MKSLAFSLALWVWTSVTLCSLWWNLYMVDAAMQRTILNIGRSFFQEIEITRLWNARHGGVYVPITAETQPNPYLDVPDRDVQTTSGRDLTKINPAFMTRQIAELAETEAGIRYHLTSLRPIRPQNRADEWEAAALRQFEAGAPEVLEFFPKQREFRYMAPLTVSAACLDCHARQGYAIGEVRGGLSVTMPSAPYHASINSSRQMLIAVHFAFWAAGMLGLFLFRRAREVQLVALDRQNRALQHEIGERHKAEHSLVQARDQARAAQRDAEAANAVKSAFLANVSHEIRTPMTAILGFTDILLEEVGAPTQRQYLTTIHESGRTLIRLLDDILDVSKLDAQQLTLTPEPTDIRQVLTGIQQMVRPECQIRNLQFALSVEDCAICSPEQGDCAEHAPQPACCLLLDSARLKQILVNLIGNAVKFTHQGGVTVTARCQPHTSPDAHLTHDRKVNLSIEVADTGIGIPADRLTVIFELFRQHDDQDSRRYGGTGLGLALVKRLLDIMGGTLHVESTVGQGSRFRVSLPGVPVASAQALCTVGRVEVSGRADGGGALTACVTANLQADAVARLPEAVRVLDDEFRPRWRAIRQALVLDEVIAFGERLGEMAATYSLPGLAAYGRQLCDQARRYDILALETLLAAFPGLLEELHAYAARHDFTG
jgi:signal transduction histidine kinase